MLTYNIRLQIGYLSFLETLTLTISLQSREILPFPQLHKPSNFHLKSGDVTDGQGDLQRRRATLQIIFPVFISAKIKDCVPQK